MSLWGSRWQSAEAGTKVVYILPAVALLACGSGGCRVLFVPAGCVCAVYSQEGLRVPKWAASVPLSWGW